MEIKCYEEDLQILPTNKPTNIYQYSESILKHMPKDSLKSFKKKHLLTVKKIVVPTNQDRRAHNNGNSTVTMNENIQTDLQNLQI